MSAPKKNSKHRASARVVDGKLILSFPDAVTPVLWQMDLHEAKASALTVSPSSASGTNALLNLKTVRGESTQIAEFSSKEDAVAALMVISQALENAQGQIRPAPHAANDYEGKPLLATYRQKKGSGWKWAIGILGAIVIVVMMTMLGSLLPAAPDGLDSAYAPPPASPQSSSGVPMNADDYLKGF